jgi:hypothetical protein
LYRKCPALRNLNDLEWVISMEGPTEARQGEQERLLEQLELSAQQLPGPYNLDNLVLTTVRILFLRYCAVMSKINS